MLGISTLKRRRQARGSGEWAWRGGPLAGQHGPRSQALMLGHSTLPVPAPPPDLAASGPCPASGPNRPRPSPLTWHPACCGLLSGDYQEGPVRVSLHLEPPHLPGQQLLAPLGRLRLAFRPRSCCCRPCCHVCMRSVVCCCSCCRIRRGRRPSHGRGLPLRALLVCTQGFGLLPLAFELQWGCL